MGTMTGIELARRCGCTPKHVSEMLNGKKRITTTLALVLERVLGVPMMRFTNAQMLADIADARALAALLNDCDITIVSRGMTNRVRLTHAPTGRSRAAQAKRSPNSLLNRAAKQLARDLQRASDD